MENGRVYSEQTKNSTGALKEESRLDNLIRRLDATLNRVSEHNKLFIDVLEKADGPTITDGSKVSPDLPVGEERYRVLYKLADLVDLAERQAHVLEKNVYRLRELI